MKRVNWGEVSKDIGQIQYAVVEAVVGSKAQILLCEPIAVQVSGLLLVNLTKPSKD